jgi:hypothetical protein
MSYVFLRSMRFLLTGAVLIGLWSSRLPVRLVGEDSSFEVRALLERQASEAMEHGNWSGAQRRLERLVDLSVGSEKADAEAALERCRVRSSLSQRYSDGSLLAYIRDCSIEDGQQILDATCRLILEKGILSPDDYSLLCDALVQMIRWQGMGFWWTIVSMMREWSDCADTWRRAWLRFKGHGRMATRVWTEVFSNRFWNRFEPCRRKRGWE